MDKGQSDGPVSPQCIVGSSSRRLAILHDFGRPWLAVDLAYQVT